MRHSLDGIIDQYAAYAIRKADAEKKLEEKIEEANEIYKKEQFEVIAQALRYKHNEEYRAAFDRLGDGLNGGLNRLAARVKEEVEELKGENYDLKLSNILSMLDTLEPTEITNNMLAIVEAVKPFTYDRLARATIEKLVHKKGVYPVVGLFDESKATLLENIEAARKFTTAYDNPNIAIDLKWYCDYYFNSSETQDTVAHNPFAEVNPQPAPFTQVRQTL